MHAWARWRTLVTRVATAGCDLLFPPQCAQCGQEIEHGGATPPFCDTCTTKLGPPVWRGCRCCGSAVPEGEEKPNDCAQCRGAKLRFDAVVPLGLYRDELREAVLKMKRPSHDALALAIAKLLIERRRDELSDLNADLIVPIPMFWRRRFRRGQNSPQIVARSLSRALDVPLGRRTLARSRNTTPQAGLTPTRRFANVAGAFRVRHPSAIRDARILLVDDILTTGATCSEAAKMLKQAGAAWVGVAIIARAEGKR